MMSDPADCFYLQITKSATLQILHELYHCDWTTLTRQFVRGLFAEDIVIWADRIYWEFCEGNSWCLLSLIGLTAEHWVWRGKRSCRRESGGRHGGCWAGGWRWRSFHPRTVSWQGNWGLHKLVSGERLPETGEVFEEESSDLRPRQGDEVHLRQGAQWRPGGREGVRV